jgi:hypothetical protein
MMYGLPFFIGVVEAFWLITLGVACLISTAALADAIADRRAIKSLNGKARRIIGAGNIRREAVRLIVQLLLFLLAVPAVFDDRDIPLSPTLVVFLCVPVVLLLNSIFDLIERRALSKIIEDEIEIERSGIKRRGGDH